jgi:hypothetical protein
MTLEGLTHRRQGGYPHLPSKDVRVVHPMWQARVPAWLSSCEAHTRFGADPVSVRPRCDSDAFDSVDGGP